MKKVAIIFLVILFMNSSCHAAGGATTSVRRSLATIIFCGLGGAVLGLSTLSFYGQPQEHIENVTTGFAIGIVAGTIYVTTTSMQDQATLSLPPPPPLIPGSKPLLKVAWDF